MWARKQTRMTASFRLFLQRERSPFDDRPHFGHELIGDGAVDQAVIEGEGEDAHRADGDEVALLRLDDDGTFLHAADAEDRHLRLIDDRSPEQTAEDAGI